LGFFNPQTFSLVLSTVMWTPIALFLGLAVATAFIAHWSDNLGKKLGKKRVSVFGLRPRTSATLLTVVSSWGIMLFTLVALLLAVVPLRTALFQYDQKRAEFDQARTGFDEARANFIVEQNRSTKRLDAAQRETQAEQTKAQNFQAEATSYQRDAKKSRQDATQARSEAAKARTNLVSARLASENAKRAEQSARAGEQIARRGQEQAAASLESAKRRLSTAQSQIGQTQTNLSEKQRQYQKAKDDFSFAQARLKDAQARTREAEDQRREAETQTRAAQAKTRTAQKAEYKAATAAFQAGRAAFKAGREVIRLESQAAELRASNDKAQEAALQYGQIAEQLAFGDIRLRADQTLAERRIDATSDATEIEKELRILREASQTAVAGFAPRAKIIARALVAASDAQNAPITTLSEDETIQNYARLLALSNQPVSARLVSALNYADDADEVLARWVFVPVRTIYSAGQTVGEGTIDATKSESAIFGQLQKLVDLARFNAVQKGSSPPLITENDNFFDGDTGPKLFEALRQLQRIGRPVSVRVIAARDLDATEPLQVRFQIGEAKTGEAGKTANTT